MSQLLYASLSAPLVRAGEWGVAPSAGSGAIEGRPSAGRASCSLRDRRGRSRAYSLRAITSFMISFVPP